MCQWMIHINEKEDENIIIMFIVARGTSLCVVSTFINNSPICKIIIIDILGLLMRQYSHHITGATKPKD